MSRIELDPERGRAVAARLKALGVQGILIKAAEQGYITELACKMPECRCADACYFEPVAWQSDWIPTLEHFPLSEREGGRRAVDNAILAHRLCNHTDYSIFEEVRKHQEERIRRRNSERRHPEKTPAATPRNY